MSSNNSEKPQVSSIPESEILNPDVHVSGQCFPSSFLVVGTAVSAKYRGAFCEATVDHVDLRFRLRVQLKSNKSCVSVDETCLVSGSPVIGNEVVVRVLNNSAVLTEQVGTVIRVTDSSIYTVVFDDGDKRTLRRTQLVLKGERHFKESESLDCLPLTNPEQFRQPVIDQRRKHRSGEDGSIIDDNMDEVEIEEVEEKVVIKESNQGISNHTVNQDILKDHEFDKGISLKDAVVGDPNCSNITERGVDVEETHLSDANTVNVSDVEATDLKHLPTGYRRLLGRLVMVDMPLTGKDCFGSPSYGSSTPVSKSPGLTPKRRFTPAVVVLPSAMPSICLGNISNTCDGGSTDNNSTRMQKSYKLLVRSFKDNRFIAVPIAFLKRLKRPNAVELAHTHPTLRSAFERALLWLDRYEFPVSWGENAVQSMLGTKNWRSSKHHCRSGSDVTESMNFTSSSLKHSRTSSPSSSEASHSPNNCRESIQKSSGKSTTKKPEKVARKRPRLTDKTQGSRSSSRLKVKRFKANILISSDTGYRRSDGSSNESNFDFLKKSAIKRNSVKKNAANQKPNKKNTVSSDDLSDSISSDEASSNSVDSDCDTRSLSSSSSSTSNLTSSSVSTVSSTSSSSSSSSSDSNISSSSSSTTRSYLSSDNSSTSSVAGFEARDRWIAQLYRFMDERGTPINKAPSLANKDLDLYKLYKLVHKLGGFHRVSSQLKWGYVYSKMDLPQNFSAGPRNLQAAFKKYLYPWDDITKKLGTNLCELPSSRPRYSSSVQNSNPVVTTCASNNSVSVSTSVSGNNTKSSRIKQSSDSVNLDTERKNNIDVIETTETSNTEEDKNVRTTAVTNTTSIIPTTAATTTTTATKKRASDKNCVIDQQSASYFKQTNDEYIAQTTPIRKSNSSSEKSSKSGSTVDGLDKPNFSDSSNSSRKSPSMKGSIKSCDRAAIDFPLINFGREMVGIMEDSSNRVIPVRSRVRVRCGDHITYEAKVLKHLRPQPIVCGLNTNTSGDSSTAAAWAGVGDIQYCVHYMGWNTRHDEVVPRSRIISVIEWGRGTDEDRPPSCSSLSPVIHEPRKGNSIKSRSTSFSKDSYCRSLGSIDTNVNEKESTDKQEQDDFVTDDNEAEDEESNLSQTTETASDNITTMAPVVRRRRLMFISNKPGRRISSRKPGFTLKNNEPCSKKISKLPLISGTFLPKSHSRVSRNNKPEESKLLTKDSITKKIKTTRDSKSTLRSVSLRERIGKIIKPVKRSRSNLSITSDIANISSPKYSFEISVNSKKLKVENPLNESINELDPSLQLKLSVMDKSSTDFQKKSVDNQHSDQLSTKKSSRRDLINTKRCTSIGLSSAPKLSSTFKSRLASSSTTVRAKKFVSKLSKLAKRKTVVNESRILSRRTAKLLNHNISSNEFSLDVDDSLKSKLSESFSPTGKNEENSRKSNHLDENSSRQSAFKGHQNVGCSSSSLITTIATASNTSVTVKYEDNKSISSSGTKSQKNGTKKRSLLKDKGVNILSHSKKKLNPVSVMDKPNTSESISVHERIEADPNGSSNVNVKKISSDKTSRKSVIKLKAKKPSNSTKENQLNKLTEYNQSIPYCEDISDVNSSSDEDEREIVIKSSRSRLRHSTRNSANSSTNSYKKRKNIHKSLTVTSNISSNSSDTYSEREANHTSEISQNESSASGSESVYNPSDALPRLTRSQHKQLLGDTPPGSALQTAAPAISNRTVSISFPTKIVSSSKRLQTKDINKSVLLKEEQANKMENNEISSSIIITGGETSSSSSETDHSQVNIPNTETVNQVKEENIQKVEDDTTFGNENTESTEVDGIDVCVKQEVIESATIQSVPDLSPEIYDDKQVDDVMMNECLLEDTISQPINIGDKQEEVEEEDGKTVEDNDTEDDRCSVQTMSTDPMDGLLYDLTMSSEKSHMQLSSKENDDLEEIDNPVNLSPHHTDITEEGGALSSTEDHPVSEISNEKEVDETTVNKTSLEPMIEKNEEEDKISEVEQANILKSRKRVRRSSNTSNSIDTPSKRGNKRTYLAPHRSTTVSENSPVRSFDSPHYPPVSPHSVPTTSVSSPMPNCSKSNDRSTSSNRRFGGPFFPIAGFDDLSSDAKCQVLQERMHRILEAWRLAKQYLKNLDQRNNRTRRLKGRQNLETSTSLGSQDNRQLVDEAHTSNDFPCT